MKVLETQTVFYWRVKRIMKVVGLVYKTGIIVYQKDSAHKYTYNSSEVSWYCTLNNGTNNNFPSSRKYDAVTH